MTPWPTAEFIFPLSISSFTLRTILTFCRVKMSLSFVTRAILRLICCDDVALRGK